MTRLIGCGDSTIVTKGWGVETWLANDKDAGYCAKIMRLLHAKSCSMHRHPRKDETFYVLEGAMTLEYETGPGSGEMRVDNLRSGDAVRFRPMTWHRFTGLECGVSGFCIFAEFSSFHEEKDVERQPIGG